MAVADALSERWRTDWAGVSIPNKSIEIRNTFHEPRQDRSRPPGQDGRVLESCEGPLGKFFWGYALLPDRIGDFVAKPMADCTGAEILRELCGHLRFDLQTMGSANCIPCRMPYITSMFMPRTKVDRPMPIPKGHEKLRVRESIRRTRKRRRLHGRILRACRTGRGLRIARDRQGHSCDHAARPFESNALRRRAQGLCVISAARKRCA